MQPFYFIKNWKKTGAVAPSSRFLTRKLVRPLREELAEMANGPLRILEIGAGTGSLTRQIVEHLRPEDHLDIVEQHEPFCRLIAQKYTGDNIEVHHADFLEYEPDAPYDFIFSSLPYESIPESVGQKIWARKLELCSPGARIGYYKYLNIRNFRCDYEEEVVKQCRCHTGWVWLNLPPARLFILEADRYDRDSLQTIAG